MRTTAQQHTGDLLIGGGQAGFDIRQENDDVRVLNGDLRLLAHERQDLIVRARFDTAGVNESQCSAVPLDIVVNAVACNAGGVLDDGDPRARYLIKERRLSHIRSADYCNYGLAHLFDLAARNGGIPFSDNFV